MRRKHLSAALIVTLGLGACSGTDPATRNAPPASQAPASGFIVPYIAAPRYTVTMLNVTVPRTLRVSEANMFYPVADIVWRGEAYGDRYNQVNAIVTEAMLKGTHGMRLGPQVTVDVEVTRFHCLTEKTRYTVGGVHSLRFVLTVRDAVTGRIIEGPRRVVADVKATGGAQAIADDDRGRTQSVVIVERLSQVIARELTQPRPGETLADVAAAPASELR